MYPVDNIHSLTCKKGSAGNFHLWNMDSWPSHPSCFLSLTDGQHFSPTLRPCSPTPTSISHIKSSLHPPIWEEEIQARQLD
jgi:hypothetical protein